MHWLFCCFIVLTLGIAFGPNTQWKSCNSWNCHLSSWSKLLLKKIYPYISSRNRFLVGFVKKKRNCLHFSICACYPCAGAMLLKIKTMSAERAEFHFIWRAICSIPSCFPLHSSSGTELCDSSIILSSSSHCFNCKHILFPTSLPWAHSPHSKHDWIQLIRLSTQKASKPACSLFRRHAKV